MPQSPFSYSIPACGLGLGAAKTSLRSISILLMLERPPLFLDSLPMNEIWRDFGFRACGMAVGVRSLKNDNSCRVYLLIALGSKNSVLYGTMEGE